MELLDPDDAQEPPPARVNAVTMTLSGTGAWAVATVAVAVVQARGGSVPDGWLDVCLAGIGLGGAGLVWAVARERRAARKER